MIELKNVSIAAGEFRVSDLSFQLQRGEHVVLMGRTGRGKTTILEAICGLRPVTSGQILLGNVDVTKWDPADRRIGYVPQDLALFPTLRVHEHFAFALTIQKKPREAIEARVNEIADLLGVRGLLPRFIQGLSGGESQRVALGRALAAEPPVLLLDEPLSALDDATRLEIRGLLKQVQQKTGVTILHVTHNRQDAEALADRVLVLEDGRVSEAGNGG
ncbi:Maltose/maltodextrin import ATP-binding protein MalK [Caulifigura coniformis]|uniref:Maltose/maltodextrin import ATP-binding protein MalK n=1 Tax=Caulifigura coniformis TaxID=2527983 RepID=A0A517SM26_9PLAN|nr:ABC transporter ATP-binding protein [Caulifigura coniformis]QDT57171.1 Maltose/maltodextrin import ATP-binding protein MalK [Caulifigura coniformis]